MTVQTGLRDDNSDLSCHRWGSIGT
jgi:hypothetical protein